MRAVIIVSVICAVLAVTFVSAVALSGVEINLSFSNQGNKIDCDVNIGFSLPNVFGTQNPIPTGIPEYTPTSSPTQVPSSPVATATAKPTKSPTKTPTATVTATIKPTVSPTKTPTATPTVKPTTAVPTLSPLQQEGISKIVGNWKGDLSMFPFGSATFSATFNNDFTASISGNANALDKTYQSSIDNLIWRYEGNNRFIGTKGSKTLYFTCDGNTLKTTVNPDILGIDGDKYPIDDIELELHRV
ncbi:MAG: hypothetical protein Q4Q53_00540 [Methanocorpusculum sp.]|nr:hypothetical protein [Methanocorpusculum sp.]